jgi:hypothetical protein
MQVRYGVFFRRLLAVSAGFLLMAAPAAFATTAATSNGTLTVTATVTPSINLTFSSATGGPALTGAGTNTATLNFGNIAAYGSEPTGVTLDSGSTSGLCSSCFVVYAPVNIVVSGSDVTTANGFSLTAELGNTDNYYWGVSTSTTTPSGPLSNSTPTSLYTSTSTGTYGSSGNAVYVFLGVSNGSTVTSQPNNSIAFIATAN